MEPSPGAVASQTWHANGVSNFGRNAWRAIDEATDLKDADTADLFTDASRGIDKLLWMVEAHVQK